MFSPAPSLLHFNWKYFLKKWIVVFLVAILIAAITYFPTNQYMNNISLFFPYIIILSICTAGISLIILRKLSMFYVYLLLIVTLAYSSVYAGNFLANDVSTLEGRKPPLNFVTYNWLTTNLSIKAFSEWSESRPADIVAIQEVPWIYRIRFPDNINRIYPYRTKSNLDSDITILSRYPILNDETIPIGDHFSLHAQVTTPNGLVDIYVIHPNTVTSKKLWEERNSYLVSAMNIINKNANYLIVAGDFNASSWDPYFRRFSSELKLHEEPVLLPPATRVIGQLLGLKIGANIDHILGGSSIHIADCAVMTPMGSDHLPLLCRVQMRERKVQSR